MREIRGTATNHRFSLLARNLHEASCERDPSFNRLTQSRRQIFVRAHSRFEKEDLDARMDVYRSPAEKICNSDRLVREAGS